MLRLLYLPGSRKNTRATEEIISVGGIRRETFRTFSRNWSEFGHHYHGKNLQPRGRGVQFRQCAILQYSKTPSLPPATLRVAMRAGRSPGFEDSLSAVAFA